MDSTTITFARWVSLVAAFVWGAVAEYNLAVAVGADQYTAVLLPLVLDVYGFAAMKSGRTSHITGALAAMVATQTVSHLLTVGDAPKHVIGLSIAISALVPAVSLACHRLGVNDNPADAEPETDDAPHAFTASTAREGFRADFAIVDEIQRWQPAGSMTARMPVDTVPVTEVTPDDNDDTADDADDNTPVDTGSMSKAEIAARGVQLKAELGTWAAAADAMGITRQWLSQCRKESGIGVSV